MVVNCLDFRWKFNKGHSTRSKKTPVNQIIGILELGLIMSTSLLYCACNIPLIIARFTLSYSCKKVISVIINSNSRAMFNPYTHHLEGTDFFSVDVEPGDLKKMISWKFTTTTYKSSMFVLLRKRESVCQSVNCGNHFSWHHFLPQCETFIIKQNASFCFLGVYWICLLQAFV